MRFALLMLLSGCGIGGDPADILDGFDLVDVPGHGKQVGCSHEGMEFEGWVCCRSAAYEQRLLWCPKETK